MSGYAVIDFETTGLFPHSHDRVVEVGVVLVDTFGEIEGEWATVVNPHRDVGPTHLHGISAREVIAAPDFADIAPRLLSDLRGRVMVAHNISFDMRFLAAELQRAGILLTNAWITGVCTMRWSSSFLRGSSRKLVDCCAAAGVRLTDAHSALHDARAATGLLRYFLEASGQRPPWADEVADMDAIEWPGAPARAVSLVPRGAAAPGRPDGWLDRIVSGMPRQDVRVESYLEVLESALLDRYLAAYEEAALIDTAEELGLARSSLDEMHRDYLRSMATVALADGVVTLAERAELDQVASLLGLTALDVDAALAVAPARHASAEFALRPGDLVCLTGEMSRPRSQWEALLGDRGLVVGGLTKKTRILVAADPDSASGKAQKARGYGVPIVNEALLERLLGSGG